MLLTAPGHWVHGSAHNNKDKTMNREPETPNRDQSGAPLMLRIAYRAATASRRTKIAAVAVAIVALGLARLNYLTEQTQEAPTPDTSTTAMNPPVEAQTAPAQDTAPVDEIDDAIAVAPPQQSDSEQKKKEDSQTEWWLLLAFAFLAGKGVIAAVTHLEKNGYTMKRWEDKINKKKKRDDDPAP